MKNGSKANYRYWTKEEECWLIDNFPYKSHQDLSNYLKRTRTVINAKARTLGLKKRSMAPNTGDIFGRLRVHSIFLAPESDSLHARQLISWATVECQCGVVKNVRVNNLKSGHAKSCGCLLIDTSTKRINIFNRTHNLRGHKCYGILRNMMARCYNESHRCYCSYGGQGIRVCDEWNPNVVGMENAIKTFVAWAESNGFMDGLTIDRIDNTCGYQPDNCRWSTYWQQSRNTSRNRVYFMDGEEKCLKDWADDSRCAVSYDTLRCRINKGWSLKNALNQPLHTRFPGI